MTISWLLETRVKYLDGLMASYAVGLLLIGQVSYEDRLYIWGLQTNAIYFSFSLLLVPLYLRGLGGKHKYITKWLLLTAVAAAALLWSEHVEYGLYKIGNLLLTSYLVLVVFSEVIARKGEDYLLKIILFWLAVLLIAALISKSGQYFFARDESFLLHGPIVFGRLMGCAAIISMFLAFTYRAYAIAFFLFSVAVFWTFSKGPALALVMVCCLLFWAYRKRGTAFLFCSAVLLLSITVFAVVILNNSVINYEISRVFGENTHSTSSEVVDVLSTTSVSLRIEMYEATLELIRNNPLGVGLGEWSSYIEMEELTYPHNIFLEVLSECGLVLGWFVIVPFVLFFLTENKSQFFYISLFLLMNQQVSGDMLDARYLLVFSILSYSSCGKQDKTYFEAGYLRLLFDKTFSRLYRMRIYL